MKIAHHQQQQRQDNNYINADKQKTSKSKYKSSNSDKIIKTPETEKQKHQNLNHCILLITLTTNGMIF